MKKGATRSIMMLLYIHECLHVLPSKNFLFFTGDKVFHDDRMISDSLLLLLQCLAVSFSSWGSFYFPSPCALMTRCGFEAPILALFIKIASCSGTDSLSAKKTDIKRQSQLCEAQTYTPENHKGFWEGLRPLLNSIAVETVIQEVLFLPGGLTRGQQQILGSSALDGCPGRCVGLTHCTVELFLVWTQLGSMICLDSESLQRSQFGVKLLCKVSQKPEWEVFFFKCCK